MNVEPSRPARPSSRTRRTVRHLAVAGMLTIPIAACSSDDSDTPTATGTAAPTVPTTASAPTETPTSTDAPPRAGRHATAEQLGAGDQPHRRRRLKHKKRSASPSVLSRLVTPGTVKQSVRWWPTTP